MTSSCRICGDVWSHFHWHYIPDPKRPGYHKLVKLRMGVCAGCASKRHHDELVLELRARRQFLDIQLRELAVKRHEDLL